MVSRHIVVHAPLDRGQHEQEVAGLVIRGDAAGLPGLTPSVAGVEDEGRPKNTG